MEVLPTNRPLPRNALIAEDNPEQRLLLIRLLKSIDPTIQIRTAESYEDAVAHLADRNLKFDWLLSDLILAGEKTGVDLFKYCRQALPKTKIALISGAHRLAISSLMTGLKNQPQVISKGGSLLELKSFLKDWLGTQDISEAQDAPLLADLLLALAVGASLLAPTGLSESKSVRMNPRLFESAPLLRAFQDSQLKEAVASLLKGGLTPMLQEGRRQKQP